MKKIGLLIVGLLFSVIGSAQQNDDDFSNFMKEEMKDFNKFIDDANKDFINFMRKPWKTFDAQKPIVKRVKPEPVKPVVFDEKTRLKNVTPVCISVEEILDMTTREGKQKPMVQMNEVDDIPFDKPEGIVKKEYPTVVIAEEKMVDQLEITPNTKPEVKPAKQPVIEKSEPVVAQVKTTPLYTAAVGRSRVVYGGQVFYINNALNHKCNLSTLNENAIADAYEALCDADYKPLLADCDQIKKDLQLNDWGVFTLIREIADAYCSSANESIVMQQFLLNESGYKARMAINELGDQMLLFVATDCKIYAHPYITLEGLQYYNFSGNEQCRFHMCQMDSPKAKNSVGMCLNKAPNFLGTVMTSTHQATESAAKVSVEIPKALINFYKDYPQCDYIVYFNAAVNSDMEYKILSSLTPIVKGKKASEAANILINFVQTAFQYQNDYQQFGYEKPFFVEELFYYPYSDCEDRAILFSYLVKKLLELDVVLLDYPEHIATAVRFNENVEGDYLIVEGQKYTVCDPTYIGASIGVTMPQFKTVSAKVLKY